jgi:RNA polymerase sigma-70 factor (ECF subfamily)
VKVFVSGAAVADVTLHLGGVVEVGPVGVHRERSESCDDSWLVEGLRKGAEEAYDALITEYQQPVYNLISRLLNDPAEACDVVQEVFLKVFRKIGAFRGDSSLKTWIYRIAVNEAYNYKRWFSRHRRQELGLEGDEDSGRSYSEKLSDPSRSPFDCASDREQHALVEAALARLNPTFRTAVVLRDVEELSYEEIAEILQVALGTVKSRILRGRDALRRELAGQLEPHEALRWTPQPAE